MFRYEKEDNLTGKGPLRFYRVVDDERSLRFELQRSDQSSHLFWFWRGDRCLSLFVEQLPSTPGTSEINLSIMSVTRADSASEPLGPDELKIVAPLIHEAVEAFWRGLKGTRPLAKLTIVDSLGA